MKKINSLLILMIILSSCDNVSVPEEMLDTEGKYPCQLPVAVENGKSSWVIGDKILIHGEYSTDQVLVTLTERDITPDGKTCYISVEGIAPYVQEGIESQFSIAYPGDLVKNPKHTRDRNKFLTTNSTLMSGYQQGEEFVLEYLVGGVVFTVEGDFDRYTVIGNNEEVIAYETLTSKLNNSVKKYADVTGDLKITEGKVVADGKMPTHICFPEGVELPDGFTVVFYKGDAPVKTWYNARTYTSVRSAFEDFGNVTSELSDYKAPVADSHVSKIPTANAIDLSAVESANCYVVKEPGIYAFKAVKGNTADAVPSIGSVELLWETWGTTENVTRNSVISAVDFQNDMIYFRVDENYHSGNAVIAAKNERDVVTWSWHIWLPETPITEDYYSLGKRKTMSRNLGALVDASASGSSVKSVGLLYQWGRKDPFVGVADFVSGTPADIAGKQMTMSGGQLTLAESVKNPTLFADYKTNWTSGNDNYWDVTKTMYDPCPPGYRVPYDSEYLPVVYGPDELDGWMYDSANNVFSIGRPSTCYPLGGYLAYDGTYKDYGTGESVWSSRGGYGFSVKQGDSGFAYDNALAKKANAYAVRCLAVDFVQQENAPGTPVMGNDYAKYSISIKEPSGICLHTDKSFLWCVGDQGTLGKISFDGKAEKVLSTGLDMEGITIDPATRDLYIGCEPNVVYKIPAPDYNKKEEVFRVPEASGYGNSGIEGVAWYKDGMILVGTQVGAYLWAYKYEGLDNDKKPIWTKVWRKCMRTIAIGMFEIADIYYDSVNDQVWMIDSDFHTIYLFNGDVTEHLASYKVPYGGNCESVCPDYGNGCLWTADDDTSTLFQIDFAF